MTSWPLDDYVLTSNIKNVEKVELPEGDFNGDDSWYIHDLTGFEDFISLIELEIGGNPFSEIDLSYDVNLTYLKIRFWEPYFDKKLDLSNNTKIEELRINGNLSELDLSKNIALSSLYLDCRDLTSLNLNNNNNRAILSLGVYSYVLNCYQVDDAEWSTENWSTDYTYTEDCY